MPTRFRIGVLLAAAPLLAQAPGTSYVPAAAAAPRLAVAAGQAIFWSGPGSQASACPGSDPCWDYHLDVGRGGERLRIAVDHATVGDVFTVEVTGPAGGGSETFSPGDGLYSAEMFAEDPEPGRWRIRVIAEGVRDKRFRLRAKLERPATPGRHVLARPNLQVLPPYDFNFMVPLTNGTTGGAPQGVESPGGVASCHPEEVVEERAVRCLRMAFGVRNTGQGPMQLFYSGSGASATDLPLYQRIPYADGDGYEDRPAGTVRWHATHGHYHHHDAVELQLFEVTDRDRGTLAPVGPPRRKGFAHRSELLREWNRFYPTWRAYGFGLGAGWGDFYEWDRPGNFVDFGTKGDGWYLVRMVADPTGGVAESNDRDNTGYTYFRVTGTKVQAIESGRGRDPWDRCKIVMPIGAEPTAPKARAPRPRSCPPDTV